MRERREERKINDETLSSQAKEEKRSQKGG